MIQTSSEHVFLLRLAFKSNLSLSVLILGLSIFLKGPIQAQVNLGEFDQVLLDDSDGTDFDHILVVYSSHRCGFCRKLRNDFQYAQIPKNLKIVFIEQDTDQEWILEAANSYRGYEVYVPAVGSTTGIDFFPSAFLFDSSGKKVKKFKGYKSDFWQRVVKKAS